MPRNMGYSLTEIICPQCLQRKTISTGAFNQANKLNAPIYCGRECAGLARRKGYTDDEKRAMKAAYDANRRTAIGDRLRAEKREHHKRTYDPIAAAEYRKGRMEFHKEYCRRPEYVAWKQQYDREYRAREYGEFAECYLLVMDIRQEALSQQTDYEIRLAAGTLNKSTKRKRDYERTHGNHPEIGALGNIEPIEGR